MDDQMQVILALVVIGIIALIYYWFFMRPDDKKRRLRYEELYNASTGGFDTSASDALTTLKEIQNPVAEDNYRAGNILEMNVLQGDLRNVGEDREIAMNIVDYYRGALTNIIDENHREEDPIEAMVMIEHIDNFAQRNIMDLAEDQMFEDLIPELFNVANNVPIAREMKTQQIVKKVSNETKNQHEFAKKFVEKAKTHTSDPQNVHDSSVRMDNQKTLDILNSTISNKSSVEVIREIRNYIEKNKATIGSDKANNALLALDKVSEGTYLSTYKERESDIIKKVWDRTTATENLPNVSNMRDAVIDGLSDCIDPKRGTLVCSVGRVSNIIGSLATLDSDTRVGAALTEEQYKNEILNTSAKILDEEISEGLKSTSKNIKKVAQSYDDPTVDYDEDAEKIFHGQVRKKIDKMVDTYKDKMSTTHLDAIRNDCYIAAGV